jgi:hypothetical protein
MRHSPQGIDISYRFNEAPRHRGATKAFVRSQAQEASLHFQSIEKLFTCKCVPCKAKRVNASGLLDCPVVRFLIKLRLSVSERHESLAKIWKIGPSMRNIQGSIKVASSRAAISIPRLASGNSLSSPFGIDRINGVDDGSDALRGVCDPGGLVKRNRQGLDFGTKVISALPPREL